MDEESVRLYEQSVAIFRQVGDREGEARALTGLGHGLITGDAWKRRSSTSSAR